MSAIRTHAIRLLRDLIAYYVPELKGKICAGPAESPKMRQWPHLSITPIKFVYYPDQASEHKELGSTRVIMNVGRFEGTVQLRLGAATTDKRADLEEKVLSVFLRTPGHPGILFAEVPAVHDAIVAWELLDDAWQDEMAFEKKWFSILTVTMQLPALVTRDSVYTIDDLRTSLTEDLTTDAADLPASDVETVKIDEAGDLSLP